jgi:hypothetical protein
MTDNEDWPITGVVVVADITKCPAGYTTVCHPRMIDLYNTLTIK